MKFWNLIRANYPLKISAGVFAVLIWSYVALQKEYQTTINVPVVFSLPNENSFVAETQQDEVVLGIKGKGSEILILRLLGRSKVHYKLDIDRGWTRVSLNEHDVSLAPWAEVSITSIEPSTFRVRVDRMIKKRLPVKPVIEPPVDVRVEPESIICRGGMDTFEGIRHIRTNLVAVDTMNLPENLNVKLDPPPLITCDPSYVTIYFE